MLRKTTRHITLRGLNDKHPFRLTDLSELKREVERERREIYTFGPAEFEEIDFWLYLWDLLHRRNLHIHWGPWHASEISKARDRGR